MPLIDFSADTVEYEFRGGNLVNEASKSTYTTPYNFMADPKGCGDLTHSKAGGTLTINEFNPTTCEATLMAVFSFKSLFLTNPTATDVLPLDAADLERILAFISTNYGQYMLAPQPLFFSPNAA
jgi:hypothetical protein